MSGNVNVKIIAFLLFKSVAAGRWLDTSDLPQQMQNLRPQARHHWPTGLQ